MAGNFPNGAQSVQSFSNCYSPDPNSNQTLSIPLNFQNVTDLNQIHYEGNAHLHKENPNGLQRISSVTARRTTQALENCIYDYSLFIGDPTENFVSPFTRPCNCAKRQQIFSDYSKFYQTQLNQSQTYLQAKTAITKEFRNFRSIATCKMEFLNIQFQ